VEIENNVCTACRKLAEFRNFKSVQFSSAERYERVLKLGVVSKSSSDAWLAASTSSVVAWRCGSGRRYWLSIGAAASLTAGWLQAAALLRTPASVQRPA